MIDHDRLQQKLNDAGGDSGGKFQQFMAAATQHNVGARS
jgi:hypothetical protein